MLFDRTFWELVTAEDLFRVMAEEENRRFVQRTLSTLTFDPVWTERIREQVASGQIELRCLLSWLARELRPKTYLEVGVRRGFSMAMVAARCKEVEIYGFDRWVRNYAGIDNPGPEFVQSEMAKIGYSKTIQFIAGDSRRTLPAFFRRHDAPLWERIRLHRKFSSRPTAFDMITIDGDHSLLGAYQDLLDTMPQCAPGGVVVFDDIAPDLARLDPEVLQAERSKDPFGWRDLLGVWRAVQGTFRNFRYFEHVQYPPGVGLAVRLS